VARRPRFSTLGSDPAQVEPPEGLSSGWTTVRGRRIPGGITSALLVSAGFISLFRLNCFWRPLAQELCHSGTLAAFGGLANNPRRKSGRAAVPSLDSLSTCCPFRRSPGPAGQCGQRPKSLNREPGAPFHKKLHKCGLRGIVLATKQGKPHWFFMLVLALIRS
jgi:hypothetical protein